MNSLIWFRNDLRLSDNATLRAATADARSPVAYVYIYDPRLNDTTPEGDRRIGPYRKNFLIESVRDLKLNLQKHGADLTCLYGDPAGLLPKLCFEHDITDVYHSRLTAHDELQDESKVDQSLKSRGVRVHTFQTQTLLLDGDVKFDLYKPMGFSKRRNLVEKSWPIRTPFEAPNELASAKQLGGPVWDFEADFEPQRPSRGYHTRGGESVGRERIAAYFHQGQDLSFYKNTRNGLLRVNDSSKFSPALSLGCVSPRDLFQEVRRYEEQHGQNDSTLWFLYELLWRDHFHFLTKERGARLFTETLPGSEKGRAKAETLSLFDRWRTARTGHPFIDAAMRELKETGWLSNRMRQIVASYLVHGLRVDWRRGARWFERMLIDYDPCSNWGNWAYIAGTDRAGQPHVFDIEQQAQMYDPDQRYQNHWMNEINAPASSPA